MTDIEKEAEASFKSKKVLFKWETDKHSYIDGFKDGAEPREKRIEEVIALINAERKRQEKCDDIHLRTIAELEKENAELKKHLPQWHDLRKNPSDLPPFNVKVNVYHKWGKIEIGKREKYSMARNGWLWSMCSDRFRYTSDDNNVIAWCELPTF